MSFDPGPYWSLTPRELVLQLAGADRRMRREHNELMTASYIGALLPWMKSRPPPLEKLLLPDTVRRRKSWQELKAALQMALGSPVKPVPDVSKVPKSAV